MSEQISKLTPNRDLQAYFLTPSAIAALSSATSNGFVLSGKWRQQFDWAVVEWNRDNVFEHPSLRNLPDGDLSGLTLTYDEERIGCIPFQSNLYPVVDWNRLRLWVAEPDGSETVYYVTLRDNAVPISGSVQPASASMTLIASPGTNRVGLAFSEEHYYFQGLGGETLFTVAAGIAAAINNGSTRFTATSSGATVTVFCNGPNAELALLGSNGNRMSMYGFSQNSVPVWQTTSATFSGGAFPSVYRVTLNFANLRGITNANPNTLQPIPTTNVRKVRWTWAADLQNQEFSQTEFQVNVSNWSVVGTNTLYRFAGQGSRRVEDTNASIAYSGSWQLETGNYSNSKIHSTSTPGDSVTITYSETSSHLAYLGLRRTDGAPPVTIIVDNGSAQQTTLALAGEDVLIRYPLGTRAAGSHTVTLRHAGNASQTLYFDFLEIAYPSQNLPDLPANSQLALATDWDTYHSQSLPAERTAWLINKLGFTGRVNHYVGALWFYEIVRTGTQYASLTVQLQLVGTLENNATITFILAADQTSLSVGPYTEITHLVLPDDDNTTIAQAFAALINVGSNLVWANALGNQLTLTARAMGEIGNGVGFKLLSATTGFSATQVSTALSGGINGAPYNLAPSVLNNTLLAQTDFWRTDTSLPRMNRAARDWHAAYFAAIKSYGMDVVAAFSTELANADPSLAAGLAQRYFDGTPVVLNTPSIQTNFSPTALAYWRNIYLEMASLQNAAGLVPYLQSGEVQWWYTPLTGVSMPFYDAYTQRQFNSVYGVPMQQIADEKSDPAAYPNEVAFLPTLIGAYTAAIRSALQAAYPACRFEVLYPNDVNNTTLNRLVNYPSTDWTPANLTCLKTESFGFTGSYDLVNCTMSINTSASKGFPNSQRSHLVGIGDAWSAWLKEVDIAQSQGLETVALFALDQYCLIGYPPPPFVNSTASSRQG